MKPPLVSIVVTTFNRKDLLKDCLDSILNQTFRDFEIIVVDNFSNYNFERFIYEFNSSKLKGFQNQNNGVIAVNRNFGIKISSGRLLAFCDDDDIWVSNKLELQVEHFKDNINRKVIVHSNAYLFFSENSFLDKKKSWNIEGFDDFLKGNPITYSSVLLPNISDVYFDDAPNKIACEDFDLWCRLYLEGFAIICVKDYLVKYRVNKSSAYFNNYEFVYFRHLYVLLGHIITYKINYYSFYRFAGKVLSSLFKIGVKKYFIGNK